MATKYPLSQQAIAVGDAIADCTFTPAQISWMSLLIVLGASLKFTCIALAKVSIELMASKHHDLSMSERAFDMLKSGDTTYSFWQRAWAPTW